MAEYTVKPGDTLEEIARQFYGDPGQFPLIMRANQLSSDPDFLLAGRKLVIPDLESRPLPTGPDPPYGEIGDMLMAGQVVPFLGAGVNVGARPSHVAWNEKTAPFLPTGAELSRYLAHKVSFPSTDNHDISDLAKVSSYFVEALGRPRVRERLRQVFDRPYPSCEIHKYLAEINAPLLIVTTNYDDLMEQSLNETGRAYDLVVHVTDRKDQDASVLWWEHGKPEPKAIPPNELEIDLTQRTVLYKMHGSVDRRAKRDSYVITEDDYVDFLSRMTDKKAVPMRFMRHFRERHFLFLGYGLNDWNLRVILKNLRTTLPPEEAKIETGAMPIHAVEMTDDEEDLRSWAIQFAPSDLERELWGRRKVNIYDRDINQFVRRLREKDGL
jgi:LysM repeat protein